MLGYYKKFRGSFVTVRISRKYGNTADKSVKKIFSFGSIRNFKELPNEFQKSENGLKIDS